MKLWDSFLEMVSDKNNLSDYKTYYSAIVQWTKEHMNFFTPEMIESNDFDFLLGLDTNEYVTENPDIKLTDEYERLKKLHPDKRSESAMVINDILMEMIIVKSDIDCPYCTYSELAFYTAEYYSGIKKTVLLCNCCGNLLNKNSERIKKLLPSSMAELS